MQQVEIYERARLARDTRFDGQFFVGVLTTGIYCRPICPATAPKRENVRFFPSAAAAGESGFRPCLRCRPECAPGTPAWSGTSTTVKRGLRLIEAGALDDGNVEQLATRLGVTSRHLRRLFTKHVGASPLAVAHTQRLHFAKQLIDETQLPLSHVSNAAGYGSIRRFNDTFKRTYGRSPRDLRKVGDATSETSRATTLTVRIPYRQPFAWRSMLAYFAARATPGVEAVQGNRYQRTLWVDGKQALVSIEPTPKSGYLSLTLHHVDTAALYETVQLARDVFDVDAPVTEIETVLSNDKFLRRVLKFNRGVRVPGAWDGFEITIRAILGQQVSVKAATTLAGRIAERYGEPFANAVPEHSSLQFMFPTPARLARARFNKIGLVRSRAESLRRVASATASGDISFAAVTDSDELMVALKSIKGIGDWTAQYVAMRACKNPDAFPANDLGLLKAASGEQRITPRQLEKKAEAWRPWRAYAAMLMWRSLGNAISGG